MTPCCHPKVNLLLAVELSTGAKLFHTPSDQTLEGSYSYLLDGKTEARSTTLTVLMWPDLGQGWRWKGGMDEPVE